ncbi:diapophytoene dehydrogenase [Arachidicoccus ginsenosidimutans]|uniref:dihydrolipoamide acetyltransferase family protein n=1 Tax=Arachidicoccus sp. BS20 TaxID=1850526 RepID=UPI0007F10366|nr:dihydrolipoamide acetyltransferase family protein [Arachidicoccus sp. BS20]ANI90640.1 diapophytoene dehydrogenase [Arachidicoccus sp. BS20]
MALVELVMPALGEGIMEATVLKWLKNVGDTVEEEEPILEIATDKVDSEVPAAVGGVIKEVFFKENDIAPIGSKIALIETASGAENETSVAETKEQKPEEQKEEPTNVPYVPIHASDNNLPSAGEKNNGFYSPLVLSIAKQEGIGFEELANIPGTGNEGRLSKKDLLDYLKNRTNKPVNKIAPKEEIAAPEPTPVVHFGGANTEIIEMDRMRKLIAHHMKESQNTSATVTSFAEADVTNMVMWRDKIKHDFEKREQTRITFTPMFIEVVARVIKRFPLINSSVDGDKIILKKNINIGMATALPNGNLIVPVIKNVDYLNLVGLSKAVNSFAYNARNNQLKPSDTQDGTFTITNVGSFGSLTGTPIINQPQVAILAIGTIKKRPVVIETPGGDTIGIRSMMILSLSYDHRIIDGALGSTFLSEVVKEIEAWDVHRKY